MGIFWAKYYLIDSTKKFIKLTVELPTGGGNGVDVGYADVVSVLLVQVICEKI